MNHLKKLFSVSAYLAVGASLLTGGDAMAGTLISSTVYDGDTSQGLSNVIINGTQLVDGDFTITANQGNPAFTRLGDGVDETIRWDFDFSNDPLRDVFLTKIKAGKGLKKALVTFDLTPKSGAITTDGTAINDPTIQGDRSASRTDLANVLSNLQIDLHQKTTVTLDLLGDNLIDESALIDAFIAYNPSNPNNQNNQLDDYIIPWLWADDVIMESATLTLETVPEPATILGLLALSTVGASVIKRKKESA